MDRRQFVARAGAGALALYAAGFSEARAWASPGYAEYPFSLGVASGDPLPDGVVLWTRLAPTPLDPAGGMPARQVPVRWELATDERMRRVVRRGTATATPELAHSVHVELRGLPPDREFFYRFVAGREASAVGRTRTAPHPWSDPGLLRFAIASCQNYPTGYFTAYRHIAEEDVALVVHLGDYIYEGNAQGTIGRGHAPAGETFTLSDYRVRYGQYKSDPDLQLAHARHPFTVSWDDHEVENNYADDMPERPAEQPGFLARRAAAYQAYYEHQPLRAAARPSGPDLRLYRRFAFGRHAEISVLDTRQYRSDQVAANAPARFDPARSITGAEQERWLLDGLARSRARWNVLAQQVFFTERDFLAGPAENFSMDAWDGYVASRDRLVGEIVRRRTRNPLVLTGDIHKTYLADVERDYREPGSPVATELAVTSITSGGDGEEIHRDDQVALAENPHIKYANRRRGYMTCTLGRDGCRTDVRVVPYVSTPGSPVETRASFVVEEGRPGLQPA